MQSQEISNRSIGLTELDLSRNLLEIFSVTADILPHFKKLDLYICGINGSMEWDVADRYFLRILSSQSGAPEHQLFVSTSGAG